MAQSSTKLTIKVLPRRGVENITFQATGRFFRHPLHIPPTYLFGEPLSPTDTAAKYWIDVITRVNSSLLTM